MSKMPQALRDHIAATIRQCRKDKFPGPGGAQQCAHAFGVTPQQWSPWETGLRTPNWERLEEIANFFGKPLEYMYAAEEKKDTTTSAPAPAAAPGPAHLSTTEIIMALGQSRMKAVYQVEISVSKPRYVPQTAAFDDET